MMIWMHQETCLGISEVEVFREENFGNEGQELLRNSCHELSLTLTQRCCTLSALFIRAESMIEPGSADRHVPPTELHSVHNTKLHSVHNMKMCSITKMLQLVLLFSSVDQLNY